MSDIPVSEGEQFLRSFLEETSSDTSYHDTSYCDISYGKSPSSSTNDDGPKIFEEYENVLEWFYGDNKNSPLYESPIEKPTLYKRILNTLFKGK